MTWRDNAAMIGVIVRHQRAGEAEAVGREEVDELSDAIGGIDHDGTDRTCLL